MTGAVEEILKKMTKNEKPSGIEIKLAGRDQSPKGSTNHADRIARYSKRKQSANEIADYLRDQVFELSEWVKQVGPKDKAKVSFKRDLYADLASMMSSCASYLLFRNFYTIDEMKLSGLISCKQFNLCQFCAARRAAKTAGKYLERFHVLTNERPDLIPVMLTLTVKNEDDLERVFNKLKNSWKKVIQKRRDFLTRGKTYTELAKAIAGVYSIEVKRGKEGQWHPHIHMALLLEDYIDRERLSEEWNKITKDSFIVDVRKFKGDPADSFQEVIKYSLKFSDFSNEDILEAYHFLKGKRLIGAFGDFRGVVVPEDLTDDFEDFHYLPYIEYWYSYDKKINSYSLDPDRIRKVRVHEEVEQDEKIIPLHGRAGEEDVDNEHSSEEPTHRSDAHRQSKDDEPKRVVREVIDYTTGEITFVNDGFSIEAESEFVKPNNLVKSVKLAESKPVVGQWHTCFVCHKNKRYPIHHHISQDMPETKALVNGCCPICKSVIVSFKDLPPEAVQSF